MSFHPTNELMKKQQQQNNDDDNDSDYELHTKLISNTSSSSDDGNSKETDTSTRPSMYINVRILAIITFILLISSYGFMLSECFNNNTILLEHYKVNMTKHNAIVHLRADKTSRTMGYLPPNTVIEAFPYDEYKSKEYVYVARPTTGFVLRKLLEPIDSEVKVVHSIIPIMGDRIKGRNTTARYTYAPIKLVIAQQLWNAVQVLQLFLSIVTIYIYRRNNYNHNIDNNTMTKTKQQQWKILFYNISIVLFYLILLPFSVYVTSPGAIIFSFLTIITITIAFKMGGNMTIEIGSNNNNNNNNTSTKSETKNDDDDDDDEDDVESLLKPSLPSKNNNNDNNKNNTIQSLLVKEEVLGLLCNLCSSLYNYNASHNTWPHWDDIFRNVDETFNLIGKDGYNKDAFYEQVYTLGIYNTYPVPSYIPRNSGSTFGSHLFLLLWSIIPFLYVSYYTCMHILAVKSPGVTIQRILLLFAIFHFLFMTDAVSYKYGRGFWSPNGELFHWFERWSWRIAVLMPIYQNCTNGHWKYGHVRFPIIGHIFHYIVAMWGIFFFILQVLASDTIRFIEFIYDMDTLTLYQLLGLHSPGYDEIHPFSYHGGLVIMWIMYLFLLISGFTPFYVKMTTTIIKKEESTTIQNDDDDNDNIGFIIFGEWKNKLITNKLFTGINNNDNNNQLMIMINKIKINVKTKIQKVLIKLSSSSSSSSSKEGSSSDDDDVISMKQSTPPAI